MRERLATLVPVTRDLGIRKIWAATIDYTPDHLPILGPAIGPPMGRRSRAPRSPHPGGHGMMWGPGVARVAADLALDGRTDLVDVTDLGWTASTSTAAAPCYDPIALPFPVDAAPVSAPG